MEEFAKELRTLVSLGLPLELLEKHLGMPKAELKTKVRHAKKLEESYYDMLHFYVREHHELSEPTVTKLKSLIHDFLQLDAIETAVCFGTYSVKSLFRVRTTELLDKNYRVFLEDLNEQTEEEMLNAPTRFTQFKDSLSRHEMPFVHIEESGEWPRKFITHLLQQSGCFQEKLKKVLDYTAERVVDEKFLPAILNKQELYVIKSIYGLGTQILPAKYIAKELGLKPEEVLEIKNAALLKCRQPSKLAILYV